MKFALGKKVNMSQTFNEEGLVLPITAVKLENMTVTGIKTNEKDGYDAIQVGIGEKKVKNTPKAELFEDKAFETKREFKDLNDIGNYKIGDTIEASKVFEGGDIIQISGVSKGKGFQGVVKRYGFKGSPATHGAHKVHRKGGSIGGGPLTRVIKGKKMPGKMGNDMVTIKNIEVVKVDEGNVIWIKGSVPGKRGTLLLIKQI